VIFTALQTFWQLRLLLPSFRLFTRLELAEDLHEGRAIKQIHFLECIVDLAQDATELLWLDVRLYHVQNGTQLLILLL